jgi:hypothetical protein
MRLKIPYEEYLLKESTSEDLLQQMIKVYGDLDEDKAQELLNTEHYHIFPDKEKKQCYIVRYINNHEIEGSPKFYLKPDSNGEYGEGLDFIF